MTIELRALGRSGLSVPPLVLGGNVFGWTCDREAGFAVLDAFVAGGGRMIDTADMYSNWIPGLSGGESESLIGEWQQARGARDRIVIATKVGRDSPPYAGLSAAAITDAVEQSLRRLRTDHIDVYFAHLDDETVPLEETLAAFDALVQAGKVRALGASHYDAARLAQAHAASAANGFARYEVLQPRYSLLARDGFEGALQDYCQANDVAVVPFYALASGFLTGKYRSLEDLTGRERASEVTGYMNPRGLAVLDALDKVAAETGATLAQVTLAWAAAQPGITAPIASATTPVQVEDLLGAMTLRLSAQQVELLDQASRIQEPAA